MLLFGITLNYIMFFRLKISCKDSFVDMFLGKYDDLLIELFFYRSNDIFAKSGTLKF